MYHAIADPCRVLCLATGSTNSHIGDCAYWLNALMLSLYPHLAYFQLCGTTAGAAAHPMVSTGLHCCSSCCFHSPSFTSSALLLLTFIPGTAAGAAGQPAMSTGNIRGLIQALPQFREVLGRLSVHIFVSSELKNTLNARSLTELGELEQNLIYGDANSQDLIKFLSGERPCCMFALCASRMQGLIC